MLCFRILALLTVVGWRTGLGLLARAQVPLLIGSCVLQHRGHVMVAPAGARNATTTEYYMFFEVNTPRSGCALTEASRLRLQ